MAKDTVRSWDTVASNNTDIAGIGIQGSNAVSNFDGALRTVMKQIADVDEGVEPMNDTFTLCDPADSTKRVRIDAGTVAAGQTRVLTMPNANVTISSFASTLLDDADAAAALVTLGIVQSTWTPVVTFATPGNLNVAYSFQHGRYVKVGKQVTVWFGLTTTTFTHTTASGEFRITGLPFASADIAGSMQTTGSVEIGPVTLAATHTWINSNISNNTSHVRVVASGGSGAGRAVLTQTSFPTATNFNIYGSISYEVTA